MTEWWDFFNGIGFKLQELGLKQKRQKMVLVEKKIADLQGKVDHIKATQQAINFNSEIKRKLKKLDRETQKRNFKNSTGIWVILRIIQSISGKTLMCQL